MSGDNEVTINSLAARTVELSGRTRSKSCIRYSEARHQHAHKLLKFVQLSLDVDAVVEPRMQFNQQQLLCWTEVLLQLNDGQRWVCETERTTRLNRTMVCVNLIFLHLADCSLVRCCDIRTAPHYQCLIVYAIGTEGPHTSVVETRE
jgi:hypothetical protein